MFFQILTHQELVEHDLTASIGVLAETDHFVGRCKRNALLEAVSRVSTVPTDVPARLSGHDTTK